MLKALLIMLTTLSLHAHAADAPDPYLWLEDIEGKTALDWVQQRNDEAQKFFAHDPRFNALRADILKILDSRERLALIHRMGDHYYNFWRDAEHPRGLWRRTTLAQYRQAQPEWETVLDLDALAQSENENWVWAGSTCLRPTRGQPYQHCLLNLSRGGADAVVVREFDLIDKKFITDGFISPEAKQDVDWKDRDTLWIATDFGAGSSTASGYPRMVKTWSRGTPMSAARVVFEGEAGDVSVSSGSDYETGTRRDWIYRRVAFFDVEHFLWVKDKAVKLDVPTDATLIPFQDQLLIRTRTAWTVAGHTYAAGALLATNFDAFVQGQRQFEVLYTPTPQSSLEDVQLTHSAVLITELDRVRARLWEFTRKDKKWNKTRVATPEAAQLQIVDTYWDSDLYLLTLQDFSTPTTLNALEIDKPKQERLKTMPTFFNAQGLITQQFEAISQDGTRIPYFIVMRQGTPLNGRNPTLIYGYGGFQNSLLPWYSGAFGKGWLEPGGVFVLANLRGGGEFGPQWHQAAQKENKQRTWDDLAAVAQDLIDRKFTAPAHLGILGGSQGGLLVTATMVQHPELFGAVVSQVPLIDMLRYHKLLAGASWIAEYGDPDIPEERAVIEKYSPYQNVKKDAHYPPLFLTTSTRDDRVHPGHARKMAARMREQGHDVIYFENTEGGHGAAANNEQSARMWAQTFSFLWRRLTSNNPQNDGAAK